MTAEAFCHWLEAMRKRGLIEHDKDAAILLDVSALSIVRMKRGGATLRTALACAALLAELGPYDI